MVGLIRVEGRKDDVIIHIDDPGNSLSASPLGF